MLMLREILKVLRWHPAAEGAEITDAQLLRRYSSSREEPAFTELVRRHGPMVLGVCRRLLGDEHAAEDAFQATFLVLVRRAGALHWHESIAGWLHEVACRTAKKARGRPATLPLQETAMPSLPAAADPDLREVLDDALAALPERYRTPLVLCGGEGRTLEEVARTLGCALGTVKSRLSRGRDLLRKRLLRRGVAVPAVALATLQAGFLTAGTVSPTLLRATVEGALAFAGGSPARSAPALLAQVMLHGFWRAQVKGWLGLFACGMLLLAGTAFALGAFGAATPDTDARGAAEAIPAPQTAAKPDGRAPLETPLPEGAIVRLGTTRFRAQGTVSRMGVSQDGRRLLTVMGGGNAVLVWDTATGQLIRRFPTRTMVYGAELSRDGERVFINDIVRPSKVSTTSVLKIYEVASGKLLRVIEGSRSLGTFALAPDERTVALEWVAFDRRLADGSHQFKSHLELRDLATDRVLRRFGEQQTYAPLSWLRFAPDGRSLYAISALSGNVADRKSTVRRFDCATGALKSEVAIDGLSYGSTLVWDGKKRLAHGNKVWDVSSGRMRRLKQDFGNLCGFLPDGKTALVAIPAKNAFFAGRYGASTREIEPAQMALWDLETDREIRRLPKYWDGFITPDGKTSFTASYDGAIQRWDLTTGKEIRPLDAPTENALWLTFSPDQKRLVSLGQNTLYVWDLGTGKRLHQQPQEPIRRLEGLMQFTPDGKTLLLAGLTKVHALDTATWKQTKHALAGLGLEPDAADVAIARLSPEGKTLAVTFDNFRGDPQLWGGAVGLWDWRSGQMVGKLQGAGPNWVQRWPTAFSADGQWLACTALVPPNRMAAPGAAPPSKGKRVQIWRLADRRLVREWDTDDQWLGALQFTADKKSLVGRFQFQNGQVCVWDVATGKERLRRQHAGTLSPDGRLVACADADANRVRIWDLTTGKQVGQIRGLQGLVKGMAFSPDGALLAVSGSDTTVVVFELRKVLGK